MWSRSGLEIAIKKCILITEKNYDEVISSKENPPLATRPTTQEKRGNILEVIAQAKANKTPDATIPTSSKKPNTPKEKGGGSVIQQESIPDQIKKLHDLKEAGIITEQEFEQKKVELLSKM